MRLFRCNARYKMMITGLLVVVGAGLLASIFPDREYVILVCDG